MKLSSILILSSLIFTSCGIKLPGEKKIKNFEVVRKTPKGTPLLGVWEDGTVEIGLSEDFKTSGEVNRVDNNASVKSEADHVRDAIQDWDRQTDSQANLINFNNSVLPNRRNYDSLESYKDDGEMGIYKRNKWFSSQSSKSIAITQFVVSQERDGYPTLKEADIILNGEHFSFAILDSSRQVIGLGSTSEADFKKSDKIGPFDLSSVIKHELGHLLGIDHIKKSDSIMNEKLKAKEYRRVLTDADKFALLDLYDLDTSSASLTIDAEANSEINEIQSIQSTKEMRSGTMTGVIHLTVDGECKHYLEGKLIKSHQVKLNIN
jgi:hypothetical protein